MARLFFLVSGENPTLPFSEAKSILEAEGFPYQVLEGYTQVLRFKAEPRCIKSVAIRSAMTRVCGIEAFSCKAKIEEIFKNVEKSEIASFMGDGESFVVRVRRVRKSAPEIEGLTLERKIGEIILKKVKGTRVDLKTPEKTLFGVLTDNRFVFGLKKAEIKPRKFVERGPRGKAFSHSSAMPPKIARCMVNLAQPRKGSLVLDPFCGTGSFLVEAGLMGFRVLGFDVKRYMVEGTLKNLALYGIEPEGMAVADARFLPLSKGGVDCVATDPPYGISATTLGLDTREVFESFLSAAAGLIGKGGLVCLAAPKTVRVGEVSERLGFKHRESHFIYIHRNLTREIAVFQRK